MTTLKQKYDTVIVKELTKEFSYKNKMEVPHVKKIVINRGLGESVTNPKALDTSLAEIALICGQKPAVTKAKKSMAAFKLRAKQPIGCKVTLRGARMYHFLDKLINICLPRIRDFRGVSPKAFDGHGNYTMGITEQLIFPEIDYDKVDKVRGMDITICTTAASDKEAKALLGCMGMPFRTA